MIFERTRFMKIKEESEHELEIIKEKLKDYYEDKKRIFEDDELKNRLEHVKLKYQKGELENNIRNIEWYFKRLDFVEAVRKDADFSRKSKK